MSIASCFQNHEVVVLGLGKTGIHAALALKAGGAKVLAWDDVEPARLMAAQKGIEINSLEKVDWARVSAMVVSPGIPHKHPKPHPIIEQASQGGVELISDIDLLGRCYPKAHYIGITGTNGKTTTTSLIGHILACANYPVYVAGNIGTSVFSLDIQKPDSTFVLEMSSFQLELTQSVVFDTAVLLNLTPDHLLRHQNLEGYQRAKKLIFAGQTVDHDAIVGVDTPLSCEIYEELTIHGEQFVIPVSGKAPVFGGVYFENGFLVDDTEGGEQPVIDLRKCPTLQGQHNAQNAAAAYLVAQSKGVPIEVIQKAMESFSAIPHRQEVVGTYAGVTYINDSKATNVDSALQALECFDKIHWILGGQFKEHSLEAVYPYLEKVGHAYLFGEAAAQFKNWLKGKVEISVIETLEDAVKLARTQAQPGETVLLAPACASFDQFKNFEARGQVFCDCVHALQPSAKMGNG